MPLAGSGSSPPRGRRGSVRSRSRSRSRRRASATCALQAWRTFSWPLSLNVCVIFSTSEDTTTRTSRCNRRAKLEGSSSNSRAMKKSWQGWDTFRASVASRFASVSKRRDSQAPRARSASKPARSSRALRSAFSSQATRRLLSSAAKSSTRPDKPESSLVSSSESWAPLCINSSEKRGNAEPEAATRVDATAVAMPKPRPGRGPSVAARIAAAPRAPSAARHELQGARGLN
mmetsp:Transcript_117120/g.373000  ORF Transcript_117120/g.373000 Transcript_117120/m.373000 type:complete len:231 (-) Transcript_117120:22-714(-)